MKIIREKSTNQVIFQGNDLVLSESGVHGKGWRSSNTKPDNYELLEVTTIPHDFQGRHYTYSDGTWTRTETGLEIAKQKAKERLAALRFKKETGSLTLTSGAVINTERDSQALVTGAYTASTINPDIVINWKGETGWIQIGATEIRAIANAVTAHVQACFTREKELSELIDIDPETDITTDWPEY